MIPIKHWFRVRGYLARHNRKIDKIICIIDGKEIAIDSFSVRYGIPGEINPFGLLRSQVKLEIETSKK